MPHPFDIPDHLTAAKARDLISSIVDELSLNVSVPSLRTLRQWRQSGTLTHGGARFSRRNILEAITVLLLREKGFTVVAAGNQCARLEESGLIDLITGSEYSEPTSRAPEFEEVTLQLLAKGIITQYQQVRDGAIVGNDPPAALQQAMARLSRLYLEEGVEDLSSGIHPLLTRCTTPLSQWAPIGITKMPGANTTVLIDPDYLVPTEECQDIVAETDGNNIEDLLERRLHREMTEAISQPSSNQDHCYSVLREFICRHPLATHDELRGLYSNARIPTAATKFVENSLYVRPHVALAEHSLISRCFHCQGAFSREGHCTLRGCREDHPKTKLTDPVPLDSALIARPEILKFWVDPGRDELRLFDALRKANIEADLYPHSDQCDVAIENTVGVDVKDYRDPGFLARKLNRGLGGLAYYQRRIIAVADRRARRPHYIDRLTDQLRPEIRDSLEIHSLRNTIRTLVKSYSLMETT